MVLYVPKNSLLESRRPSPVYLHLRLSAASYLQSNQQFPHSFTLRRHTAQNNSFIRLLLRTLLFSVHCSFHSKVFAFNRLRTLLQNMGGVGGCFPIWNSFRTVARCTPASRVSRRASRGPLRVPSYPANDESRGSRALRRDDTT